MKAQLQESVEICKDALAAFDNVDDALNYMPGDSGRSGLKNAFIYASTMPHDALAKN